MRPLSVALSLAVAGVARAQDAPFAFEPPGQLVAGSGQGDADDHVYLPGILFPIEHGPAFANSQVWGHGGNSGPGGGQCDVENYSYPWHDIFCETRDYAMPLCPAGHGHQGQDVRPPTCEDRHWWAVAAADGTITNIGTYSVSLTTDDGSRIRYLHMNPDTLAVVEGQRVARGDHMGLISNAFGGTPTTIHLHFDVLQDVNGVGSVYVPPYTSLVAAYEDLMGVVPPSCDALPAEGGLLENEGPCFTLAGPPASWRHATDAGHGGDLYWTYVWDRATPGNTATWQIVLAAGGSYRVEVYIDPAHAGSRRAPYTVRHAGQDTSVALDLTATSADNPWLSLGDLKFAAGGDQEVTVFDNSGELLADQLQLPADALRLTRLDLPLDAGLAFDASFPLDAAVGPPPADAAGDRDAFRPFAFDAAPGHDARAVPGPVRDAAPPAAEVGAISISDGSAASERPASSSGCAFAPGRSGPGPWPLSLLLVGLRRRRSLRKD